MRKLQVGVIGGYSDLKPKEEVKEIARRLGELIAREGWILVCGGEIDGGVVREAMKGAKEMNGTVVGILTYKDKKAPEVDIWVDVGGKYGLREYILAISCDVIIAIDGGSGTLNEITVAYQNKIPIIAIVGTGGWADKLANNYLDNRKKIKIVGVKSPEEAIQYIKENLLK